MTNRTLAITLGLVGWGLAYIIAKSNKNALRRDSRLSRKQLTTWEGEGGNLPPSLSSTAANTAEANP
ncbi:MAG: hypothetical protein ACI8WM_001318 [Burkholderiaceae bacterium]|jgi:hypothetical protein